MLQQVPGAHLMFGNRPTAPVHNQLYDFNDDAIPYGVALLAAITEKKLPRARSD
jgi:hippurate hydrolase